MILRFVHQPVSGRVLFGWGTLSALPDEAARLNINRPIVLSTVEQKGHGEAALAFFSGSNAGLFSEAAMHTPVDVTEKAVAIATERRADGIVAIGGGSTTGLAKAIALRTDLPQIIVPTTYAGSEMTPILGQTEAGKKTTLRSPKVLPEVAIYDVELTLTLPTSLSVTSGLNAIAHAAEALYARDSSPIVALMAEEGIRALAGALPEIVRDARSRSGREGALYGAWLCGVCLGTAGMSLHHKLCHVLGGSFDLPHAPTHAVILPHALAFNLAAAEEARQRMARAIGSDDPAGKLHSLATALGAPTSLRELGMPESEIKRAAALATKDAYWNPRPFDEDAIENLLRRAWHGLPPGTN